MVSEMVVAVYSDDLQKSKKFYVDLLGLVPIFDSDWVVQMTSRDNENLNLTLQLRTHDPDGLLVDVSSDCEPSAEFVQKYMSET